MPHAPCQNAPHPGLTAYNMKSMPMNRTTADNHISADYFARPTLEVARGLLGARLVRRLEDGTTLSARIVETEAYTEDDPACHGWRLRERSSDGTPLEGKGAELYGRPGTAYVYLCYGIHWLFNVVTEPEGSCGAVLVRAVEPVDGIERMRALRSDGLSDRNLTNGPGKLTQALDIDDRFHDRPLDGPALILRQGERIDDASVVSSPRIGISRAKERKWRFHMAENRYVSAR